MNKRSRLALPKSPGGRRSNDLQKQQDEAPIATKEQEIIRNTVSLPVSPVAKSSLHSELQLYQEGLDGEWLQLAWMRQRYEASEPQVVMLELPTVTCKLGDILPKFDKDANISPKVNTNLAADNVPRNDLKSAIQAWIKDTCVDVNWESCQKYLGDADWFGILSMPIKIEQLAELIHTCSNDALTRQLWLNDALLRPLLQYAGERKDTKIFSCLLESSFISQKPPKEVRALLRKLDLRTLGTEDNGIYIESELVRLYTEKRVK